MHRQQLDGCDPERDQVLDGCGMAESGVGPAKRRRNSRMELRESLDVQLVDRRLRPGDPGRAVMTPREGVGSHHRVGHVWSGITVVVTHTRRVVRVTEDRLVELEAARDLPGVRVQQQLARVVPVSGRRVVRPVHPQPVALARTAAWHVPVPDGSTAFDEGDPLLALGHVVVVGVEVEEAEIDRFGAFAVDRHVDAGTVPGDTERSRTARPGGVGVSRVHRQPIGRSAAAARDGRAGGWSRARLRPGLVGSPGESCSCSTLGRVAAR